MTPEETTEWNYVYHERIAILVGTEEPTRNEIAMAIKDADQAVLNMKKEQNK